MELFFSFLLFAFFPHILYSGWKGRTSSRVIARVTIDWLLGNGKRETGSSTGFGTAKLGLFYPAFDHEERDSAWRVSCFFFVL
ncbi:hypothetical protein V8C34DRAFT_285103 [Trichoderma compactum]